MIHKYIPMYCLHIADEKAEKEFEIILSGNNENESVELALCKECSAAVKVSIASDVMYRVQQDFEAWAVNYWPTFKVEET